MTSKKIGITLNEKSSQILSILSAELGLTKSQTIAFVLNDYFKTENNNSPRKEDII